MESETSRSPSSASSYKHHRPLRPYKHYRKTKAFFKTLFVLVLIGAFLALAWFLGTRM